MTKFDRHFCSFTSGKCGHHIRDPSCYSPLMTSQPHDALFKAAFERPAHAAGLLRQLLPPSLANAIDWSTLALEPGSFVDTALAKSHTDLLFSAKLDGKKVLLYVLLEHQSRNDPQMTYRVLRYLMRIWHRHLKEFGEPLPLIIALIVSHAPGGWTSPVRFHDMISPSPASLEGVETLVPGFTILVEDLAHVTDEELRDWALDAFPELVVRALRDGRNRDRLMRNLDHWGSALSRALAAPSGIEAVSQLFRYITLVCEGLPYEEFRAKLREQLPEAERPAMTIAEELMQKGREEGREAGREEGREEGRAQGQVTLLVKQLTRKFGELPAEYRARLETATSDLLECYAERLLVAGTLAAVFTDG
jgi:predicted transposase YdaD